MLNIKKAIPTKAGTAQSKNVSTTYKINFTTNKPLRTAAYIDIARDNLFFFGIKGTSKTGKSSIVVQPLCNLRTTRGL